MEDKDIGVNLETKSLTDQTINTLLIIGNGFDKHCKLASTFSEYYEKKCKDIIEGLYFHFEYSDLESAMKLLSSNGDVINFWSFLFYVHYYTDSSYKIEGISDTNWFDIEQLIHDALTKPIKIGPPITSYIKQAIDALNGGRGFNWEGNHVIRHVPYAFFPFLQKTKLTNVYDYLLEELNKFEKSFKEYMIDIVDQDYKNNCNAFLKRLLGNVDFVDLINFNYTTIDNPVLINRQTNVHGELFGNEIIIGIDSDSVQSDDLIRFTKTYRNIHRTKEKFVLPERVDHLIFYGHSLADADFSYFHSLFDMYHLYDGKLTLTFYYSDYCKTEVENEIKHAEYVRRVYKLIKKYSEKSRDDNNLLHRLLLEGRIVIQRI